MAVRRQVDFRVGRRTRPGSERSRSEDFSRNAPSTGRWTPVAFGRRCACGRQRRRNRLPRTSRSSLDDDARQAGQADRPLPSGRRRRTSFSAKWTLDSVHGLSGSGIPKILQRLPGAQEFASAAVRAAASCRSGDADFSDRLLGIVWRRKCLLACLTDKSREGTPHGRLAIFRSREMTIGRARLSWKIILRKWRAAGGEGISRGSFADREADCRAGDRQGASTPPPGRRRRAPPP